MRIDRQLLMQETILRLAVGAPILSSVRSLARLQKHLWNHTLALTLRNYWSSAVCRLREACSLRPISYLKQQPQRKWRPTGNRLDSSLRDLVFHKVNWSSRLMSPTSTSTCITTSLTSEWHSRLPTSTTLIGKCAFMRKLCKMCVRGCPTWSRLSAFPEKESSTSSK